MKGIFNLTRFVIAISLLGFMIYFAGKNNKENYCKLTDITIEMDPDAMIYDLSSDQLNYSLQRIEMINNILGTLKEKYTENNDTYDELFRSYRTLVYSYFQALEVVSRKQNAFITNDVINDYLLDNNLHPDSIKMNDVSFKNIESLLSNHPSIRYANVYSDMQGKVFVSVIQRNPIVRVQNGKDGYYLDEDGLRMPLSNEYTARMLLVTGEVNLVNENDLYYLSDVIIKDEFLKKQIVQIDINKDSELLMLTQIGEQVEFGQIKEVGEKFKKLKLYYEKGNSQNQEYKTLNLKYKNQIVCIKK